MYTTYKGTCLPVTEINCWLCIFIMLSTSCVHIIQYRLKFDGSVRTCTCTGVAMHAETNSFNLTVIEGRPCFCMFIAHKRVHTLLHMYAICSCFVFVPEGRGLQESSVLFQPIQVVVHNCAAIHGSHYQIVFHLFAQWRSFTKQWRFS